jgi:hypothetical protein
VAELQGMPGMHRHTLQFWQQSKFIYVYIHIYTDLLYACIRDEPERVLASREREAARQARKRA